MTAVQSALPPGADPRAHTRLLARVRAAALTGGTPPAAPRPVIGASWRRLRGSGLDPSRTPDVVPLDGAELERRRAESGLAPLLPLLRERLLPVARDAGQVLVVVDAGCRVLWREGGAEVRRRADRLGFVEGSCWDEDVVGTNAIGTSVVVRAPLQVHAAEHYAEGHQPWTCAAAPLRDPVTGRVLGWSTSPGRRRRCIRARSPSSTPSPRWPGRNSGRPTAGTSSGCGRWPRRSWPG
ncbi:GAF domain-containing protein [Geodermatophilus chilensis]|uniref:GAF domain-containing protein n=1 Tax=Geodermatophilus chilensis TaxID=2035835 RepID=UPI0018E48EB7|nr:GAF domain-containing protein [Geodermatophilus chilensis]